jgi:hypothetical protein
MPFPVSMSGEVRVSCGSVDRALGDLLSALEAAGAVQLQSKGDTIEFRGGLFRWAPSWNILGPISSGSVKVVSRASEVVLRYRLGLHQLCVVAAGLTAWIFFGVEIRGDQGPAWGHLYRYALIWLWLVGGNYLLLRWRWPRFLSRLNQ